MLDKVEMPKACSHLGPWKPNTPVVRHQKYFVYNNTVMGRKAIKVKNRWLLFFEFVKNIVKRDGEIYAISAFKCGNQSNLT